MWFILIYGFLEDLSQINGREMCLFQIKSGSIDSYT